MRAAGMLWQVVPGFVDEGFEAWQIVQPENDIVGLQKICGDKLAFIGCWDLQAKWITPGVPPTEEELRQKVRDTIDLYGPGGNIGIMGLITNPNVDMFSSMMTLNDEIIKYGTGYYCR